MNARIRIARGLVAALFVIALGVSQGYSQQNGDASQGRPAVPGVSTRSSKGPGGQTQNPGGQQNGPVQTPPQSQSGRTFGQSGNTATPAQEGQIGGAPSSGIGPLSSSSSTTSGRNLPGAAVISPGPNVLSLEQAIRLAIQNNLATLLATERRREARGLERESLAGLLPNVSATAYQANITQNLAALGFQPGTFPGLRSTFIGPFNNFDARARLVQTIFSLTAIRNFQAGRAGVRVAEFQESLAREQVATATALTYIEVLRAGRAIAASQANVELAQTLFALAQNQRNAGIATGVDVTRAETRLAEEQVRMAQAQVASEQARLNLQRVVGLTLGSNLTLSDPLTFAVDPLPSIASAITLAGQNRPEVKIAEAQVRLSNFQKRAVRSELLPSLDFVGDYGVSGITPGDTTLPTRRAAVELNVPLFNGGLTRGRIAVAASLERQAQLELGSVRGQVEEDVRLAYATIMTTSEQVRAADQSVLLSSRELDMARDRFRAGVGDNVEVITAQASLSSARDAQVTALAQYNVARLNLAASLGRAEAFR